MRLLIGWVIALGLAAVSRFSIAPWVLGEGQRRVDAYEPGDLDLVAPLMVGSADILFGMLIPTIITVSAAIMTLQMLAGKLEARVRRRR